MPITREQADKLGIDLIYQPGGGGYNERYYGGYKGVQHEIDSGAVDYLKGLGYTPRTVENNASTGYNTVGGGTINNNWLDSEIAMRSMLEQQAGEQSRVDAQNRAGGFYVGPPQTGSAQDMANLEASGTVARNALLPEGVQPGQAFGEPAQDAQLQQLADINPELADQIMDQLGYTNSPSKVQGYQRVGNDVYDAQGNYISFDKAKELGIVDQLAGIPQAPPGQADVLTKKKEGIVTTSDTKVEQNDFFKGLQDRYAKLDEMVAGLLSATEKSKEQKDLEKTAGDLVSSYEAGLTDLNGEVIPMDLILGGQRQLQAQATDKLNAINRTLERLQGNQDAQIKVLERAYDLTRQSINDAISFYQLTQPEKISFNSETGEVVFYNPMTQEVSVAKAPGYTAPNEFKYVDLGNRVAVLDKNGKEVDSFTKGQSPGTSGSGGFGNYTEDQLKVITKINQDVSKNATYAKTSSMRNYADNVVAALALGTGTSDIAAINQFQKVIDEGAVTRDQDVVLIQSAQSLANQLQTKIKGLQEGDKLSATQRNEMRNLVEKLYTTQVQALNKDPYIAAKNREAQLYGLTNNDTILGELGGFDRGTNTVDNYVNQNVEGGQTNNQYQNLAPTNTTTPAGSWYGSLKSWLFNE